MTNPVIDCLLSHRSIRKFSAKPIESEKMDLILKAGTRAATAGNLQLYTFVVIDDIAIMKELDRAWKATYIEKFNCPVVIVALIDQYRVRRWLEIHSSHTIHNNGPINFFLAIWDALIALQNMVIAAESLELGTCYIGSVLEIDIQRILQTPEHVFPAGLVCVGYPDESPQLSMRLPLDAVVHKNSYRMPTDDNIVEWYKERDRVWETVSETVKKKLNEQGINGIAQSLAVRKYSKEVAEKRSKGILENLRKSKFDFTEIV